jgi:hypothetical protein
MGAAPQVFDRPNQARRPRDARKLDRDSTSGLGAIRAGGGAIGGLLNREFRSG